MKMKTDQDYKREDATIQVIAERINSMQNDVSDLRDSTRDSMEKMSVAITKLVQMEERQLHMNQSYDRLSNTLDKMQARSEKLEERVDDLEKEQPMTKQVVDWAMRAVYAIVAAAAMFVAKMLGLFWGAFMARTKYFPHLAGSLILASAAVVGGKGLLDRWEPAKGSPDAHLVVYADKLAQGLPTVCNGITKYTT